MWWPVDAGVVVPRDGLLYPTEQRLELGACQGVGKPGNAAATSEVGRAAV